MMGFEGQTSGRELRRIVRINEEIKTVVKTAYRINLMAMNAIFLAKRAGQSALGFGVLSNELRRFATDLERQMIALGQATSGSVVTVTAMVKEARTIGVLERAREQSNGLGRKSSTISCDGITIRPFPIAKVRSRRSIATSR
jgi:hypothetical protein